MTPFYGILRSQEGIIQADEHDSLPLRDLLSMDWLLENIVGHIPSVEELRPEARSLVLAQGVKKEPLDGGSK